MKKTAYLAILLAFVFSLVSFVSVTDANGAGPGIFFGSSGGMKKADYDADGDGIIDAAAIPEDLSTHDMSFGSVNMKATVTHSTTGSIALTAAQSNGVFTNSMAEGDVTYTLPQAVVGIEGAKYTFVVTDTNNELYVDPNAADQFRGMYPTNANGDKLQGDKVEGSILNIICLKDDAGTYRWFTSGMGVWADAN